MSRRSLFHDNGDKTTAVGTILMPVYSRKVAFKNASHGYQSTIYNMS